MAGMHKHKWSYTVKYAPDHFGHDSFKPPNGITISKWLNLLDLPDIASAISPSSPLDLGSLGYDKLLGQGTVQQAYTLKVPRASARAVEKIKAAGGSIQVEIQRKVRKEPSKDLDSKKKRADMKSE